jgi:hypothetical protein
MHPKTPIVQELKVDFVLGLWEDLLDCSSPMKRKDER